MVLYDSDGKKFEVDNYLCIFPNLEQKIYPPVILC